MKQTWKDNKTADIIFGGDSRDTSRMCSSSCVPAADYSIPNTTAQPGMQHAINADQKATSHECVGRRQTASLSPEVERREMQGEFKISRQEKRKYAV